MPQFDVISQSEALAKTATGKRTKILTEYLGYLEQLKPGQAGKLTPGAGERATAVRRRLGTAAKAANVDLVIRRAGDEVIFWMRSGASRGGPSGRPRKARA